MKVCIVGTGNQGTGPSFVPKRNEKGGTGMAGLLAQESDCEELVLIDISIEKALKAENLVRSLGERCKCTVIKVYQGDASDQDQISNLANGVDLIFNGIYAQFNYPLMRACLAIGAHYVDLRSNVCAEFLTMKLLMHSLIWMRNSKVPELLLARALVSAPVGQI